MYPKRQTTINDLRKVKSLIKKGWCKHYHATKGHGRMVGIMSREATNFCLMGAIFRVCGTEVTTRRLILQKKLEDNIPSRNIISFNDTQTSKYPVLKLIDKAIKEIKEQR